MLNRFLKLGIREFFSIAHQRLINRMQSLGYFPNQEGVCFGFSHMVVQAILAEDLKTFSDRLEAIDNFSPEQLAIKVRETLQNRAYLIKKAKENVLEEIKIESEKNKNDSHPEVEKLIKIKTHKKIESIDANFSSEERILLDIPAFFDGVKLHAEPHSYVELFDDKQMHTQNAEQTFPLLLPQKLDSMGGIENVGVVSGIYTNCWPKNISSESFNELYIYFSDLEKEFKKDLVFTQPFAMCLSHPGIKSGHAITISYDFAKSSWIFIDSNDLPIKYLSTGELYKKVRVSFGGVLNNKGLTAFTTTFFTAKKNSSQLKDKLEKWQNTQTYKKSHRVTKLKAGLSDDGEATWLVCAAWVGQIDVVNKLLDVEVSNTNIARALQIAVQNHHRDVVTSLLKKYNETAKTEQNEQYNFLILAIIRHDIDTLNDLLAKKIDIEIASSDMPTPLMAACALGQTDSVDILLAENADPNKSGGKEKITPLIAACENGNIDIINKLLAKSVDPNKPTEDGVTPLHTACILGKVEVVTILLAHDININQANKQGVTPVIATAIVGSLEILQKLLKCKASVNSVFQADISVLLTESERKKRKNSAEKLFQKSQWLKMPTTLNFTALHMAAYYGHIDIVRTLIENGAMIDSSKEDISALEMAQAMGHREIAVVLEIQSYVSMQEYTDPNRRSAIKKFLSLAQAKNPIDEAEKIISVFKEIDMLAKKLMGISSEYKPDNPQRCKSLDEINVIVAEAYKSYALNPQDASIIKILREKANKVGQLAKEDHEKTSMLSMFGKGSKLNNKIIEITEKPKSESGQNILSWFNIRG